MAHHAIKRLGPTGLIAIFVALTMSLLAMAAGNAAATTQKQSPTAATAAAGKTAADKAAAPKSDRYSKEVTGTTSDGRTVTGTFTPRKFHVVKKKLVVNGMLQGTITGGGKASRSFHRAVSMPVEDVVAGSTAGGGLGAAPTISCDVLNLVLGPLDLNLLGLQVHLDQVVLNIIAVPGALLGDLLCAVANLLSGGLLGGLLTQLAALLNQILGALNLP
jgi:hypothetical protein